MIVARNYKYNNTNEYLKNGSSLSITPYYRVTWYKHAIMHASTEHYKIHETSRPSFYILTILFCFSSSDELKFRMM